MAIMNAAGRQRLRAAQAPEGPSALLPAVGHVPDEGLALAAQGARILDASAEGCLLACDAEAKLGQRVLVDDGSCPAGQIKQVTGARLTSAGVEHTRACVPIKQRR